MSARNPPSQPQGSDPMEHSLLERLRARLRSVNHVLQRRDTRPVSPTSPPPVPANGTERSAAAPVSREVRALNVVYHGLARAHRRHRERTGESVSPSLKAAARAFKREPSIASLVPVAAFLDDLRLLKW